MFHYFIYGFSIQSQIPLPAGRGLPEKAKPLEGDIDFRILSAPATKPPVMDGDQVTVHTDRSRTYANRLIGEYHISEDGSKVTFRPYARQVNELMAGGFFVGVVLPYILQFQGLIPIHGSGILIRNRVWGFLGGPGIGKSTLQTQLLNQGAEYFSDDVIPLKIEDEQIFSFQGYPAVKLEPSISEMFASHLFIDVQNLPDGATKAVYCLSPEKLPVQKVYPLGGLFLLHPHGPDRENYQEIEIEKLRGSEAVIQLLGNIFTVGIIDPLTQLQFLSKLSLLVEKNLVYRLSYPRKLEKLPELVLRIEKTIKKIEVCQHVATTSGIDSIK
jgi:hypothetical protein